MVRKKSDSVEGVLETTLRPGRFIDYRSSWDFVSDLEKVKEEIERVIKTRPQKAVEALETFIVGCYEKAEEVDGSSGSFGMFVQDLFSTWIRARQAAKADPQATARQLLHWMDNDDYGFCYEIEKDAIKAFNRVCLNAFADIARSEFTKEQEIVKTREKGDRNTPGSFRFRRLSEVLRAVYAAQQDVDEYLAVAGETELTPSDCETIARIFQARRKPQEALGWVERGLGIKGDKYFGDGSSYSLAELKRKLLKILGRKEDALDSAWKEFREEPSEYSYRTLMSHVPPGGRSQWRAKVLKVAGEACLRDAIDLYIETKEWGRLADLVRRTTPKALEDLSHYTTEPAANKLEKSHPDAAARLYRALGLRRTTDAGGRARFEDLLPGRHTFSLPLASIPETAAPFVEEATILVRPGRERRLTLGSPPESERLVVALADHQGVPLAGILVRIEGPRYFYARSGPGGEAVFEAIPAGAYTLSLERTGFPAWSLDGEIEVRAVAAEPGGGENRKELVLGRATIRGKVFCGDPAGLYVLAAAGKRLAGMELGPDGRFAFADAAPGKYAITVSHPERGPLHRRTVEVEVPAEGDPPEVEVRLDGLGVLLLEVAAPDGRPVPGAKAACTGPAGPVALSHLSTGARGAEFGALVDPGDYRLGVTAPGHPTQERLVTVGAGEEKRLKVLLP